ncbi:hypothetical protein M405DRAFT_825253 [Rhizopogon salebrosus TDB-379]|nr:hypothetical protein M405DRAFT_825253 [Rhizopogon salebrosus TDB-379]
MSASSPQDAARETKLSLPNTWHAESADAMGSMGMFLAGLVLVSRNRYLAWPVALLALSSVMNQHPLRTKEGGSTPWATLMTAVLALIVSHAAMFTFTNPVTGAIKFSS